MRFKRFAVGLAIFILTILFIVFVDRAFNAIPSGQCNVSYPSSYNNSNSELYRQADLAYDACDKKYQEDLAKHDRTSFLIVTIMSVLAIIAGVLVMSVGPVSWGLILAGLVMILYVLIANFEEVGKPWRAIISGAALAILIWLSYAKLGDKEMMSDSPPQDSPPGPDIHNATTTNPPPPISPPMKSDDPDSI